MADENISVVDDIEGKMASYRLSNGICTITMHDDSSMNAVGMDMNSELLSYLKKADEDDAVKVIVLASSGRGFSSGGNIKEMLSAIDNDDIDGYIKKAVRAVGDVSLALRQTLKPVIAKINGAAAGAGMNIALACDYRIVSDKSKFIEAFVNIGLIPDAGGTTLLSSIVGPANAMKLISLGKVVDAQEADNLGLATKLVFADELDNETDKLAEQLTKLPQQSLRRTKNMINQQNYAGLADSINQEIENQRALVKTHDFQEGVQAFVEKREAHFIGE